MPILWNNDSDMFASYSYHAVRYKYDQQEETSHNTESAPDMQMTDIYSFILFDHLITLKLRLGWAEVSGLYHTKRALPITFLKGMKPIVRESSIF